MYVYLAARGRINLLIEQNWSSYEAATKSWKLQGELAHSGPDSELAEHYAGLAWGYRYSGFVQLRAIIKQDNEGFLSRIPMIRTYFERAWINAFAAWWYAGDATSEHHNYQALSLSSDAFYEIGDFMETAYWFLDVFEHDPYYLHLVASVWPWWA